MRKVILLFLLSVASVTVVATAKTGENTVAAEVITETTEAETETAERPDFTDEESAMLCETRKYYRVNGAMLSPELQDYCRELLKGYDLEWYMPYLMCQMYQESRYDQNARSKVWSNGSQDIGLMQLKSTYHIYFAEESGCWTTDLYNDTCANIYCGIWLISEHWKQTGSLNWTISAYMVGNYKDYSPEYVTDVLKWFDYLEEV